MVKTSKPSVCRDKQGRTCIQIGMSGANVRYIPLDISNGFQIHETSAEAFNVRFAPMLKYPIERGCQLYLNYCRAVGASAEVLEFLSTVIEISKEDRLAILAKRKQADDIKAAAAEKKKKPTKKKEANTSPKKPPAKKTTPKISKNSDYTSASQMFQALILSGKFTDNEIFNQVQEAFGLAENRRSYVKWYRNKLIKDGKKPPEAKQ